MSLALIEGFKVYYNGKKSIIIDSNRIDECMQFYSRHNLDSVAVTTSHDYKLQNVNFLSEYPNIKHISISDGIADISAIHTQSNLESLVISGKNRKLDFLHFPLLKDLIADWSPHFLNLDKCIKMNRLALYHFNPKSKDFSAISNVPWIKKLEIVQSPITSLNGLEHFDRLKEIELFYCSKLETLCCLEKSKKTLISMRYDHCKSIKNHDYVTNFPQLQKVAYVDAGAMPSIKFIKAMKSLKSFIFMGTNVADGDITPCIGLDYVAFTKKSHFSHSEKQIKALGQIAG